MLVWLLLILVVFGLLGALWYWLWVITEGVYLGQKVVVWQYDQTAVTYDDIKQYDEEVEEFFVVHPLLYRLQEAGIAAPLILDVATGTGRLPVFTLNQARFNGRFIGLDASLPMLRQAQTKLAPYGSRALLIQQVAQALPFPSDSFHAVSCLEALEFFLSEEVALREMIRVLKPGGTLMVTLRKGWEAYTFIGRYYGDEAFTALLTRLGLTEIDIQPWQLDYALVFAVKRP